MASLREQILARVQALLIGNTPAGANVFRAREVSITRAMTPTITVLYGGSSDVQRMGMGVDRHTITINVAIFVRGDPWDQLADAIDEPAHRLIIADATLKAMGVELRRGPDQAEAEEADRTAGALIVPYHAIYLAKAGDIAAAP